MRKVVSVTGDFNGWDRTRHPMRLRDGGIWILHAALTEVRLKYSVLSRADSNSSKADPYGIFSEVPPRPLRSCGGLSNYAWAMRNDGGARKPPVAARGRFDLLSPISESWMRGPQKPLLTYRDLASVARRIRQAHGYTHLELMPVMEHPFSGSWGYQVTLLRAHVALRHTRRFSYFVDQCHQGRRRGDLDWVPAHFRRDAHAALAI